MPDEKEGPDRYLTIDTYGSRLYAPEDELNRLKTALREHDAGGPAWFMFEHLDGRIINLRLSTVEHFGISTPENREKFAAMEKEQHDEDKRLRPWGDDD
jgi:hypothetical protein